MTRWISLSMNILLLVVLVGCASTPQEATQATIPTPSTPTPADTMPEPMPPQTAIPASATEDTKTLTPTTPVSVTAGGRLAFVEHRYLTFGTSGKIGQVSIIEMDKVTKGQLLAKLDTTSMEQAVKAAELEVSNSEIALKSAEIDLEQASDDFRKIAYPYSFNTVILDVPEALVNINYAWKEITNALTALKTEPSIDINTISSHLNKALDDLKDSQSLLKRGFGDDVFGSEYRPVEDFWTMRAAQLNRDNAQLDVGKARNDLDSAKNDLDKARDELDKAVIIAPFDGVIAKVNVKEGEFLSSATFVAIEMIDPIYMELDVKVNELDILNVNPGQKVTISVDALPDVRIDSVVTSINPLPVVESGVVSYDVKVFFYVPQNSSLKAGMRATADIIADKG
ncbi:HlyD family secretion protein [Chloroflexota bacterium]